MAETYLKDELAETLAQELDRLPEGRALLDSLAAAEVRAESHGGAGAVLAGVEGGAARAATATAPSRPAPGRPSARVAVRGLAGSASAALTSWLQRKTGRTVLYLVPHGEGFEAARDDIEYFRGAGGTLAFPEPDTLPYDPASPHPGITAQRLETLARLDRAVRSSEGGGVVLATVRGLLQRVPKPARLARSVLALRVGEEYDPFALMERLVFMGYERLPEVEAVGHFARRGGILDVYPVGLADPLRLEFDGDTLVSLRRFDSGTQRSLEQLAEALVLPRYEVVVAPEEAQAVAERLRAAGDEKAPEADGGERVPHLFHDGMERFASHYDRDLGTLLDYLPDDTLVVLDDPGKLRERADELGESIARTYAESRAHYPAISPPEELYLPSSTLEEVAASWPGVDWMGPVLEISDRARYVETLVVDCVPAEPLQRSMERLKNHLAELGANGIHPVILCDNTGQRDRLWEMLGDTGATLGVGLVSRGFTLRGAKVAVLTDHEIFARYRRQRRRYRQTGGLSLAELSALKVGDYVVHEDHGIGVYRGMKRLTLNGQETDCVEISYAEHRHAATCRCSNWRWSRATRRAKGPSPASTGSARAAGRRRGRARRRRSRRWPRT